VRPKLLQFDFASLIVLPEREQVHAWGEAVGMAGVQFDRDFAMAALRFQNAGEGDKVVVDGAPPRLPVAEDLAGTRTWSARA